MLDSIAVLAEVARAHQRRALRVAPENELPRFAGTETRSTDRERPAITPDTIERSASAYPQELSVERLRDADIDIHHLLPTGLGADATRAHLAEMVSLRRGLAIQMRQNRNPLAADEHSLIADAMAVFLSPARLAGVSNGLVCDHQTLCIEHHAINFVNENRHSLLMLTGRDSIGRSFLHVKKDQIANDISMLSNTTASLSLFFTWPVALPILTYNRLRMINKVIESRKTGLEDASQ